MRNVRVVLAALCLLSVACSASFAQAPEARRGEIVLEGWVLSADEASQSFIMAVRAYTLPPHDTIHLQIPRARVVQVAQDTPIHVRWNIDESAQLTFKDIQPGVQVVAAGPNVVPKRAPAEPGEGETPASADEAPPAPAAALPTPAPATPAQPVSVIAPLPALNVALWTGKENGRFVFKPQSVGAVLLIPQPSKPAMSKPAAVKGKQEKARSGRRRRR